MRTKPSYITPLPSCLIVDGDLFSAAKVEKLLMAMPLVNILGIVPDANGVREILKKTVHLDIVFLITGAQNSHAFEIAKELRDQVECMVFIGNNNELALKAFEVGGDDFLETPLESSILYSKVADLITRKLAPNRLNILGEHLCIPIHINNAKTETA